jgi:hypothetical protein
MTQERTISFGDRVRVRITPEATAAGLAGLEGDVYGFTTPSVTSVMVIGAHGEDYALNVSFGEKKETFWFAEDQLEFISHSPGTEIRVGGVQKKWVRAESGEWIEHSTAKTKPWWRIW